jgi:hypothetical protein
METMKAKIHMLPTKEKTDIILIEGTGKLEHKNNLVHTLGYDYMICQQLYFTTDEEIKEGDWFYYVGKILKYEEDEHTLSPNCKKIVATTDKSLGFASFGGQDILTLPHPSQAFLEKYCKVGGIDEVLIEMEEDLIKVYDNPGGHSGGHWEPNPKTGGYKILIKFDNTITIHPIKDSWTREEVLEFGLQCGIAGTLAERQGRDFNEMFLDLVNKYL